MNMVADKHRVTWRRPATDAPEVRDWIPVVIAGVGVCRGREQNQGNTDLTDQTDSTDRSSLGSAPCSTSQDEVFDHGTPIEFAALVGA